MLSTEQTGILIKQVAEYTMDRVKRTLPGFRETALLFWGPQGVGKTTIAKHAATELHIPSINLRLAQYPPEDFGIPRVKEVAYDDYVSYFIEYAMPKFFPQHETKDGKLVMRREIVDGQVVETNEPRINFRLLKNHISNYKEVAAYYESIGLDINDAPGGILLLDEITRISDPNLFQMIFQLPENYGLRDYKVPAGITIFAAANPPTDDYQVGSWFDDAAFANRFIHIETKGNHQSWKRYARKSGTVSERVMEFYTTYPKALFDPEKIPEFDINAIIHPSPRSAEYLHVFDELIELDPDVQFDVIQGILGTTHAMNYKKFCEEFVMKAVTGEEIMNEYDGYDEHFHDWKDHPTSGEIRQRVIDAREGNRADFLNETTDNLVDFLESNILKGDFKQTLEGKVPNIIRFLFDLPSDVTAATIKRLIDEGKPENEAINDVLTRNECLYKALKALNEASKATK